MGKFGNEEISSALNSQNLTLKCQERCELQTDTPTFTSSVFPIESTFPQQHFFCLTLFKVARICNDSNRAKVFEASLDLTLGITCKDIMTANNTNRMCLNSRAAPNATLIKQFPQLVKFLFIYAKNNFAVLNVLIKDPYYTLITREEQISLISFLGNAGGIIGGVLHYM